MKTYIKPTTMGVALQTSSILAASGQEQETVTNGMGSSNTYSDKSDLTRGKSGFGSGMWEDMK